MRVADTDNLVEFRRGIGWLNAMVNVVLNPPAQYDVTAHDFAEVDLQLAVGRKIHPG